MTNRPELPLGVDPDNPFENYQVNPYATHLPVLEELVPHNCTAVEFGCGLHSTPFLLERCSYVLSIEMQKPEWIDTVHEHLDKNSPSLVHRWRGISLQGPWRFLGAEYPPKIDFALVDGHKASRCWVVNFLMQLRVPIIVAHDTNARGYGWEHVVVQDGYQHRRYKDLTPHTDAWILSSGQ
jgi:hypothetical protein